ncbi:unnamed protein product [Tenebrio molitor]|nr:unnamed protein product [Tenebrio molitor]
MKWNLVLLQKVKFLVYMKSVMQTLLMLEKKKICRQSYSCQ